MGDNYEVVAVNLRPEDIVVVFKRVGEEWAAITGPLGVTTFGATPAEALEKAGLPSARQPERAAVVAYLKDRADWLKRERFRGGAACLAYQENECRALAKLIEGGRHHKGGHLGG